MMNKKLFIETLIQKLEKRLEDLEKINQRNAKAIINAPSAMQSWSDTSRFQLRSVAANLESQLKRVQKCLDELKNIDALKKYQKIEVGALVEIKLGKEISHYFISPAGSGAETININNELITTLSVDSPLAKKLSGKKSGSKIKLESSAGLQDFFILEII